MKMANPFIEKCKGFFEVILEDRKIKNIDFLIFWTSKMTSIFIFLKKYCPFQVG